MPELLEDRSRIMRAAKGRGHRAGNYRTVRDARHGLSLPNLSQRSAGQA